MKITILGSSAAYAGKNEGCSSYLLTCGSSRYLVDTGPGCVSFMQNYITFSDINGIFLSHLHADHMSDIYTLRYAVFIAQRDGHMKPGLPIYMPSDPKKTFRFIRETVMQEMDITEISQQIHPHIDGLSVHFLKTTHPIDTYAIRFEYEGRSIVYTADTAFFNDLVPFCTNTNLLIADATLQSRDRELESMGHMTAASAAGLARDAGAQKLILSHIWPEYKKETSLHEAQYVFHGPIFIAERGQEHTI